MRNFELEIEAKKSRQRADLDRCPGLPKKFKLGFKPCYDLSKRRCANCERWKSCFDSPQRIGWRVPSGCRRGILSLSPLSSPLVGEE